MRFPLSGRKAIVAGLALCTAGGAAAVAVPAIAAHSPVTSQAATASVATDAGRAALGRSRLLHLLIRATVTETGLDRATVLQRLAAGQTLAQVAGAKAQAVETDALALLQKRMDRAEARGRITKSQETGLLTAARSRADTLMSTVLTGRLKHKHGGNPQPVNSPDAQTLHPG